jgi:hypothetical protein
MSLGLADRFAAFVEYFHFSGYSAYEALAFQALPVFGERRRSSLVGIHWKQLAKEARLQ